MKQLYSCVLTQKTRFPFTFSAGDYRRAFTAFFLLFYFLFAEAQTTPVNGITTFNTIGNGAYIEYAYTSNGSGGFLATNVQSSGWDIRGYTSGPDDYVIAGENWGSGSTGGFVYLALTDGSSSIISMRFKANDGKVFDLDALDLGYDAGSNITFTVTGYRSGTMVSGAQFLVPAFASFGNGGDWRRGINISTNTNFLGIDEFRITPNTAGLLTALDVDNINATNFRNVSTLPLRWLEFTAISQDNAVMLRWRTKDEQNTKDFLVEHSTDGRQWEIIGTVDAAGISTVGRTYSFTHGAPVKDVNMYRLMQRDHDGRSSYSPIVTVNLKASKPFTVYPNPVVNGILQIKLTTSDLVSVYNSAGMLVIQKKLPAGISSLSLDNFTKGVYTVKVNDSSLLVVVQ